MTETKKLEIFKEISVRAEKMNILMFDQMSLMMNLKVATKKFNLRINELLEADDFNFSHDIIGIQNNIDRNAIKENGEFGKMTGLFVPRFASH